MTAVRALLHWDNGQAVGGLMVVVECHVSQAMLEEFGKWIKPGTSADQAQRDEFYSAIYQQVLSVRIPCFPLFSFLDLDHPGGRLKCI